MQIKYKTKINAYSQTNDSIRDRKTNVIVNNRYLTSQKKKVILVSCCNKGVLLYMPNAMSHILDPPSLKNNPYIKNKNRHYELQRKLCDKPGCINNICIGLCGIHKTTDSIGHGTHGQAPVTETDKKTVPLSTTDFNGQKKQQNAVMYKKPHKPTQTTPEHAQGTQQINSDTNIMTTITQNEDKTIIP